MDEKRRAFLQGSLAAAIGLGSGLIGTTRLESQPAEIATRPIPSTGEQIPIVGLGTWITFNVGNDPELLEECAAVMMVHTVTQFMGDHVIYLGHRCLK